MSLGRSDEAIGHYDQAVAILKEQADRTPDLPGPRSSLVPVVLQGGMAKLRAGRLREGEADIRRAVALRDAIAADFPRDPGQAIQVWRTAYDAGIELGGYLPPGEVLPLFEKVSTACRAWLDKDAKNLSARTYLAASLRNRAAALATPGPVRRGGNRRPRGAGDPRYAVRG